jgi:hypothetical protein
MPTINQLSSTDTLSAGDQVPVYVQGAGDARKASMSTVKDYVLSDSVGDLTPSAQPIVDDDYFAIEDSSQSTTVKVTADLVLAYMQANLVFPSTAGLMPQYETQRAAPSSNGFSVQVTDTGASTWLVLTPTAGFAAGAIVLPAVANAVDKQEVLVNCTQLVNALTINGNGATAVTGEPLVLAADDFFKLRFDAATSSWYRVG